MTTRKNVGGDSSQSQEPAVYFVEPPKRGKFNLSVLSAIRKELIDSVRNNNYGKLSIHPRLLKLATKKRPVTDEQLKVAVQQEALALFNFYTYGEETCESLKFDLSIAPFSDDSVTETARIISVAVNDFTDTDQEETRRIAGDLKRILKSVPVNARTTKVVSARAVYNTDDPKRSLHLTVTHFINLRTGRCVVIYLAQVRMS